MSVKGRVSVIIPSRNEAHLQKTVADLLAKAAGDVEILVMLEGLPWPDPPLPDDPRVRVLFSEVPRGMRPSINEGVESATGEWVMKCDAHMIFSEGYDEALKSECDGDWLVVPMRHSIHPDTWTVAERHYVHHYLVWPWRQSLYGMGLHAKTFDPRTNRAINKEREQFQIDDMMGCQGSCWFQSRENFMRLGPLDHTNLYFYSESIGACGRQWASGGRCVVTRRAWAGHLHKGREHAGADGRRGRGYYLDVRKKWASEGFSTGYFMADRWPDHKRTFKQFIDRFSWLLDKLPEQDRWPSDWDNPRHEREFFEMVAKTDPGDSATEHLRVFADAVRRGQQFIGKAA